MFSASVRFNLDPFKEHSDDEIWQALEQCQMKDHLSLPGNQGKMAEGGNNFRWSTPIDLYSPGSTSQT